MLRITNKELEEITESVAKNLQLKSHVVEKLIHVVWDYSNDRHQPGPGIWVTNADQTVEYYRGTLAKTGVAVPIVMPLNEGMFVRLRQKGLTEEYDVYPNILEVEVSIG